LKSKLNILCITPISHLKNIKKILKKNHTLIYRPNLSKKDLIDTLKNDMKINAIFCNPNKQGYVLDKNILDNTNIKVINTASTGTDHINLLDCKKLGIEVLSLKNDKKLINKLPSTSELSFCLMISLLKNLIPSSNAVRKKEWNYENFIGQELASLTVGIVGFGRLGKMMAKFCDSFGMRVLIYDKFKSSKKFKNVSLEYIAKYSHVISLHVHLNETTHHLIDKKFLSNCKLNPVIINTSRGNIVDEHQIISFLNKRKIFGYGADVISHELININDSPIINNLENFNILVTPHIGGMTIQGQNRAFEWAASKFI
jgi:lactate dehydrogenase-like 2-hydroxyacid dehydrogenase